MNTHSQRDVSRPIEGSGCTVRFVCTTLLLSALLGGCVAIEGGAVEFTWSLRTFEGKPIDVDEGCAESEVGAIRLCWSGIGEGDCLPGQFRDFACSGQTGTTLFEIPEGPTRFRILPICDDEIPAEQQTFEVPADIVRTVRNGQVVTLDALLVVISDPESCSGSECTCLR